MTTARAEWDAHRGDVAPEAHARTSSRGAAQFARPASPRLVVIARSRYLTVAKLNTHKQMS